MMKLIKDFAKLFLRRKIKAQFDYMRGIISGEGGSSWLWESTDHDPQFYLSVHRMPRGWVKVKWSGCSDGIRHLRLFMDYGAGFSEETAVTLGTIVGETIACNEAIIQLGDNIRQLRLDPGDHKGSFTIQNIEFTNISRIEVGYSVLLAFLKRKKMGPAGLITKIYRKIKSDGVSSLWMKVKELAFNRNLSDSMQDQEFTPYTIVQENENEILNNVRSFKNQPLISVLLQVTDVQCKWLIHCVNSVINQSYTNWELLVINTSSDILKLTINDSRIRYIHLNNPTIKKEHIASRVSDSINGEYFAIIEQEDELSPHAFYYYVNCINLNSEIDVIYGDEDRITEDGDYFAPFHKAVYSKDDPSIVNLMGLAVLYNTKLLAYMTAQQGHKSVKDILLERATEIMHIPKVLYHNRNVANATVENAVKLIAFYLPQFHPIPENDKWWGKGFTEWTNVTRGKAMFDDHYQPHLPGDLGFYDLRVPETRELQTELAKEYGIYGFCYYYYWFNGRRLLERPLNDMLNSEKSDFPFCICWANESWTRRWDGAEREVLMPQVHNAVSDERFIDDVIPVMKDSRYIKINGAPLLLIYRVNLFPDATHTIELWRKRCMESGISDLHICIVQSFGLTDPRPFGADSAVEFPPHGVNVAEISNKINNLDEKFNGNIYDYREVVERALQKQRTSYPLYRGVMLGWDNTARRGISSNIFHHASPAEYQKWLTGAIDYTKRFHEQDQQLVFINAWNEWAEGTHLEPDQKYGHDYLIATKKAITTK